MKKVLQNKISKLKFADFASEGHRQLLRQVSFFFSFLFLCSSMCRIAFLLVAVALGNHCQVEGEQAPYSLWGELFGQFKNSETTK